MKKVELRELCKPDQIGKYGIPASAEEFDENKTRYLRISDIDDFGNLLQNDKKSVSSDDLHKYILNENDIVFARTGNSTGRTYFHEAKNGKLAYAGFLIKYGLDSKKVNPKYLKYFTISEEYRQWVKNLSVGSTRGNINAQTFADCPVILPKRKQQDDLVKILSDLDAKIELNNRINAELEAMAKLVYEYWFVQFDFPRSLSGVEGNVPSTPLRDHSSVAERSRSQRSRSQPYKSSGGKMVWNEELKREIPEGWRSGYLSDLGKIIGGSTPSKEHPEYFTENEIPWITPKDLSNNIGNKFIFKGELDVTEKGRESASLNLMPRGSILMSSRAPIGYLAISVSDVTTNQGFKSFVPEPPFTTEFIYYKINEMMPVIENNASGSTFKEVSGSTLKGIKIIIPKTEVIDAFTQKVSPLFEKQEKLQKQNQELSTLRDWLLPMLMNGQVSVAEAEERVEEELGMVAEPEREEYKSHQS